MRIHPDKAPAGPSLVPPQAPQPPAEAKGGGEAPKTDKKSKRDTEILKAFTDHIDLRFVLLDKLLCDKKRIAIIPGDILNNGEISCAFATGLAKGQWQKCSKESGTKMADECAQHFKKKSSELLEKYKGQVLFGNVGVKESNKFLPQFPVGNGESSYNELFSNNDKGNEEALVLKYESLCNQLKIKDKIKDKEISTDFDKIKEYRNLLFKGDGALVDKTFIHAWGANVENFNNKEGEYKGGGGQADAFNDQVLGVFGICSTPHLYNHDDKGCTNALAATCNTHEYLLTPSPNPKSPIPAVTEKILGDEIGHV